MDFQKLCGWKPNYDGIRAVLNDPENKYPVFNVSARNVLDNYKPWIRSCTSHFSGPIRTTGERLKELAIVFHGARSWRARY